MAIEIKYAFDNQADYSYDLAKVEVTGGVARLKLAANAGQSFNEDFADDTGFTYDSSKLLFTGGTLEQKTVWPQDASWGASFATTINGSWGNSPLVPTSTKNNPQIVGEKLDLVADKNVVYDATGSINPNKGAIKIKFTPNYNGTPSTSQQLFYMGEFGTARNRMHLDIAAGSGAISARAYNNAGGGGGSIGFGNWADAIQGQEYEIEFNWDFTAGSEEQRLFIDGIQKSGTANRVELRDDNLTTPMEYRQGGSANSNHLIADVLIFDEVQHTSNYTPGYDVIDYANDYGEASAALPSFVYSGVGSIQSFDSLAVTGDSSLGFTINGKWWDGGAWSISDGSHAQSTSLATINMHIGSLQVSNSINVVTIFPASSAKQSIEDLSLNYAGQTYFTGSTILPNAAVPASSLSGFMAEELDAAGASIRYVLEVDTVLVWWDGVAWVASSGVAETNTAQEISDNFASLALSPSGSFVRPFVYFITDGSGTSELESVSLSFVYDVNPIQAPAKTVIFGSLRDIIAEPFSSASLRVENSDLFFKTGTAILPSEAVGNTNGQAVAYVELVRTGPSGYKYSFYIDYYDSEGSLKTISLGKSVAPDDEATNIATLTFE